MFHMYIEVATQVHTSVYITYTCTCMYTYLHTHTIHIKDAFVPVYLAQLAMLQEMKWVNSVYCMGDASCNKSGHVLLLPFINDLHADNISHSTICLV